MATKKALVLADGKIQQLQSGDLLDISASTGGSSTSIPGYISGLSLSYASAASVFFTAGSAWCGSTMATLGSTIGKNLNSTWVQGSGNGGRFANTLLAANTTYHCFILRRQSDGAIDAGYDTSLTAANRPSGWDARIVGSIITDSSNNIRKFFQIGDWFYFSTPIVDLSFSNAQPSGYYSISVPSGISCRVQIQGYSTDTSSNYAYVASGIGNDDTADFAQSRITIQSNGIAPLQQIVTSTSASRAILIKASGPMSFAILTLGFEHPRGQW